MWVSMRALRGALAGVERLWRSIPVEHAKPPPEGLVCSSRTRQLLRQAHFRQAPPHRPGPSNNDLWHLRSLARTTISTSGVHDAFGDLYGAIRAVTPAIRVKKI